MKRLLLPALCVGSALAFGSVWAAPEEVTQDSSVLSQIRLRRMWAATSVNKPPAEGDAAAMPDAINAPPAMRNPLPRRRARIRPDYRRISRCCLRPLRQHRTRQRLRYC